jgi:hypothetical protein
VARCSLAAVLAVCQVTRLLHAYLGQVPCADLRGSLARLFCQWLKWLTPAASMQAGALECIYCGWVMPCDET